MSIAVNVMVIASLAGLVFFGMAKLRGLLPDDTLFLEEPTPKEVAPAGVPASSKQQHDQVTSAPPAASTLSQASQRGLACFYGPDPVPVHRDGQCSGPSHPLGLWLQDVFVADAGFKEAYFIAQDVRKCNVSKYWSPQKQLYGIDYTCKFQVQTESGSWGEAVSVKSHRMHGETYFTSQLIIHCAVPEAMRQYGDNSASGVHARLSVVLTPHIEESSLLTEIVAHHGPVPSTKQIGLCAHPVDRLDRIAVVEPLKVHRKLSMCLWAADSYNDRFGNKYSAITAQTPEWLEYHLSVGVEHFYVYDNSVSDRGPLWQLLQPHVHAGIVTYIRWPHKVCVPKRLSNVFGKGPYVHRSSQYAAGASCLRRFAQYNDWMGFFDADEYMVPAGLGQSKPGLPATLSDLVVPHTSKPNVYSVAFAHTYYQPCGDYFDPRTHRQPVWQTAGEKFRFYYMRSAADIGSDRRAGAQGDNAALWLDAFSCTDPPDTVHYCGRDKLCPPGETRRSWMQVKQFVKPYKVLYHHVHYPVLRFEDEQKVGRTMVKLNTVTQGKMVHLRSNQPVMAGRQPDRNLTRFWLPELRRVLMQPHVAKRMQAVQACLSGKVC